MKMKPTRNKIGLFAPALLLFVACATSSAKDAVATENSPESSTEVVAPMVEAPVESGTDTPTSCDGSLKLDRTQRLAVIAKIVLDAENELETNPESIKDASVRARLGTFAAGSMSDTVRFVSMDQRCWAHLYEAQTKLAAEDDKGAKSAADAWQNCLEDQFPNRVALAQPYFSCFVGTKAKKKK